MIFKSSITILLFLNVFFSSGQPSKINSFLNKKGNNVFGPAFLSADSTLASAKAMMKNANDLSSRANACNALALAYSYTGQLDSSVFLYQQAKDISLHKKDIEAVARINIAMSNALTRQFKIDEALQLLIESDSLNRIIKDPTLQADVQWSLGIVYKNNEEYRKASNYFKAALVTFKELNNFTRYIGAGCNLSMAYRSLTLNDSSLYVLMDCMNTFKREQIKDTFLYAEILENLGDTYLQMNQYAQALAHFNQALTHFSKFNSALDIVYQKYSIGLTLSEMNRFSEAEVILKEASLLSDSLNNYKYSLWIAKTLSNIYVKEKDWNSAYTYLQKSIVLADTISLEKQIEKTNALNKKFETEKNEREIILLKSRTQIIVWTFISAILLLLLGALFIWLLLTGRKIRDEKILNYFATSLYNQNTIDDVFWDIAKNCISQLKFEDCVIYGYDEARDMLVQKAAFGPKNTNGHTISNLIEIPVGKGIVGSVAQTLRPEIIKDTRKDSRYIVDDARRNAEIALPILIDGKLLGVLDSEHSRAGFFTKRHLVILEKIADICSKKVTRYFVEEGLRKKIARDLHDDMGSTLSSINIISKVALLKHSGNDHLKKQLASIKDYSSDMMESMSDMVWAINPHNDSLESLLVKMKEWAAEICEPKQIVINFEEKGNAGHVKLDAEKRKHVFLIFKEAINNAAKYSNCKNISIQLAHDAGQNNLELIITDDGDGFDVTHHKTGNGLHNMRTRAGILQGQVQVVSSSEDGSCIHLVCQI